MSGLDALASYDISDDEEVEKRDENEEKTKTVVAQVQKVPEVKKNIEEDEDIWRGPDEDEQHHENEEEMEEDEAKIADDSIKDVEDLSVVHEGSDEEEPVEEEGGGAASSGEENEDVSNLGNTLKVQAKRRAKRKSSENATNLAQKLRTSSVDEVTIPPEPEGRCSASLQEKITRFMERKVKDGEDLNHAIQARKDFRNPSIYEKLILYLGIEELGTNFPPQDFDPKVWKKAPAYDELARAQREDMAKREKERKTKVEFVTGTVKKPSSSTGAGTSSSGSGDVVKKSKWDQQVNSSKITSDKSSAHKPTVISAIGSIKKPKL